MTSVKNKTQRVDFICFTTNNVPARREEYSVELNVVDASDAVALLKQVWAAGVSKSSVYQIQTDAGIFSHADDKFLTPAGAKKVVFKSWAQLDAEGLDTDEIKLETGKTITLKKGDTKVVFTAMYRAMQVATITADDTLYSEKPVKQAREHFKTLLQEGYLR